jgi:arylsulfatase A-like enzyme
MPKAPKSPGRDYAPVLRGEEVEWDNVIFYDCEHARMIRTPEWKYTRRYPDGPDELYHLEDDPGERLNLVCDPGHADTLRDLRQRLDAFFDRYAEPKYDLWKGGGSQTILLTFEKDRVLPPPTNR